MQQNLLAQGGTEFSSMKNTVRNGRFTSLGLRTTESGASYRALGTTMMELGVPYQHKFYSVPSSRAVWTPGTTKAIHPDPSSMCSSDTPIRFPEGSEREPKPGPIYTYIYRLLLPQGLEQEPKDSSITPRPK